MVADRVAAEYLVYVQKEYKEANLRGYAILGKQAEAIRAESPRSSRNASIFGRKMEIISRSDNQGILTERLKRLDGSLTDYFG